MPLLKIKRSRGSGAAWRYAAGTRRVRKQLNGDSELVGCPDPALVVCVMMSCVFAGKWCPARQKGLVRPHHLPTSSLEIPWASARCRAAQQNNAQGGQWEPGREDFQPRRQITLLMAACVISCGGRLLIDVFFDRLTGRPARRRGGVWPSTGPGAGRWADRGAGKKCPKRNASYPAEVHEGENSDFEHIDKPWGWLFLCRLRGIKTVTQLKQAPCRAASA